QNGERVEKTEWHRIVTYQPGLVDMLEKHAKKGRLIYVSGTLRSRSWRKEGEDSDRSATEILLVPQSKVLFLDRLDDRSSEAGNGVETAGERTGEASAGAEGTAAA
ncbi:MAG: single-stranded DNA-binding protein, partial [Gammaproteobacteria bacterium]|nr:single-stranded DNA-binding protein [Gammaproteobacteria bacterium]